jgi:DNA repair exonuclease SbcCD ATPase subunit
MLTGDELERALAEQQATGERLGETIVKLGFVSGPELASALAAQYGIELTTEKGFGTGLRSEIQRRHESDRKRIVRLVPDLVADADPPPAAEPEALEPEPEPDSAEGSLLAQLEEQWAKLAAAEEALAEREREREELARSHRRDVRQLEEVNERLRAQIEELRQLPVETPEPLPVAPASHLVFVHLDERYELISREGPPPAQSTPLSLPDVDEGTFVVAGRRSSPLPGDERPCVFVQRG